METIVIIRRETNYLNLRVVIAVKGVPRMEEGDCTAKVEILRVRMKVVGGWPD